MQTTNTSIKQAHFNQSHPVRYDANTTTTMTTTTNLASFSTSEPHLCNQFVHDVNCAKNTNSYLNQAINRQPD